MILSVDVGLDYRRGVISTATSKVMEDLAQPIAIDIAYLVVPPIMNDGAQG